MKKIAYIIVLIIAVTTLIYSASVLIRYGLDTKKTKEGIRELTQYIPEYSQDETEETLQEDTPPEDLKEKMEKKYGQLYEKNKDFIGWLKIDDIGVDNPVMYTPDDPEHYLRLNFNEEYDIAGMLFADARSELDPENMVSTNIIIYGHRMNNDTMFGPLRRYKDEEFVKEHKTVQFDTLYRPGRYEVFSVILAEAYDTPTDAFKYYQFIDAFDEDDFNAFIDGIKDLSIYYDEDAAPSYGDELLTLSTCDYYKENGRLALICRRIGN